MPAVLVTDHPAGDDLMQMLVAFVARIEPIFIGFMDCDRIAHSSDTSSVGEWMGVRAPRSTPLILTEAKANPLAVGYPISIRKAHPLGEDDGLYGASCNCVLRPCFLQLRE